MTKEYKINLTFHKNGRLKSISNEYNSEYGSMSDVLHEQTTARIIELIKANRDNPEKENITILGEKK